MVFAAAAAYGNLAFAQSATATDLGAQVAVDIDGSIVAGSTDNASSVFNFHPAAWNLSLSNTPIDITPVAGVTGYGSAYAVSGNLVVGYSNVSDSTYTDRNTTAFAYNVATATMTDLLAGGGWCQGTANAVSGNTVVGYAFTCSTASPGYTNTAFAVKDVVTAPTPINLGNLAGGVGYEYQRGTGKDRKLLLVASGVTFAATVYDGGTVQVCAKKSCKQQDRPDWFGVSVNGHSLLGESAPIRLSGGSVLVK